MRLSPVSPFRWARTRRSRVAFGAGSRWSIDASRCAADWQNQLCPEVTRADLGTGAIEARIALQAVALAYGEDGLWAINAGDTGATYISSDQCELAFVDPVVNEVTRRFDLPGGCERQAQARTIPPIELFVAAGSAWGVFQSPSGPLVKRMDLSSGELTAQITLRNAEQVLTADRDGTPGSPHTARSSALIPQPTRSCAVRDLR